MKKYSCGRCGSTLKEKDFENGKWKYKIQDNKPIYFCLRCWNWLKK